MRSSHDYHELGRLITLLCDDALAPAELEQLEAYLRNDPAAQRFYQQYIALDADLCWSYANVPALPPEAMPARPTRESGQAAQGSSSRCYAPLAALVSALAATIVLAVWLSRPSTPNPPATAEIAAAVRIEELSGGVEVMGNHGTIVPAVPRQALLLGQTVRTGEEEGFAVVQFADTTRLELGSATMVRLVKAGSPADGDGKRLFLSAGLVRASVGAQPARRPLILATPHAEIIVAGTRFTSFVAPETTRIEVEDGRVTLIRQADGNTLAVGPGSYAEASAGRDPLVERPLGVALTRPRTVLDESAEALAVAPGGATLATGWKGRALFYDLRSGLRQFVLEGRQKHVRCLSLSPDGTALATGGQDPFVELWDLAKRRLRLRLEVRKDGVQALAFSLDGRWLAALTGKSPRHAAVWLWDVATGAARRSLGADTRGVVSLAFAPDNRTLAGGTSKGMLHFWDAATGMEVVSLRAHKRRLTALAFAPDGTWFATASQDGTVKVWDTAARTLKRIYRGYGRRFKSLAVSPNSGLLAAGADDGSIRLWKSGSAIELATLRDEGGRDVDTLAFSPDGRTLAAAARTGPAKLWSVPDAGAQDR
jgi:ferric-dicitrate binding protein FerR (iron transport regulator)